ncbi:ribosomal-processing cysteine protease Prp [Mollicutes bacterium LVI A0078]|nr:ribosomal-processing cysteine protease Prp [Mollicutes bacterium LVI A0075]WOO91764.1 ribosomal-processing cysteine protease Prp [Mollicutes bacterium LVI A0078]
MIHVHVNRNVTDKVEVTGHAEYSEIGSDIVCSAVSMIMFTIANKLDAMEKFITIEIDEEDGGYMQIEVVKSDDETKLLMDTLILGLEMIEEQYNEYIDIREANNA